MSHNESLKGLAVLVVCSDWPWPPNYAARIDVLDRIKLLHKLDLEVDVLVTAGSHDLRVNMKGASKYVRDCFAVRRLSGFFDMLGWLLPGQVHSRKGLSTIEINRDYDFVLLEGHYLSPVLENPTLSYKHLLLRVNNDERLYFLRLAFSKIGVSSVYYLLDALRFCWQWPKLMRRIPVWMFSSEKEFKRMIPFAEEVGAKSIFMPPNVNIRKKKKCNAKEGVLFIGTLLMPNNLQAIKWYLDNVHSKLLDIDSYELNVAGHVGTGATKTQIKDMFRNIPRVNLIPSPETVEELYDQSAIFINPMRNGAGIKLKTVHALAAGIPVVTTSVGSEGTCMRDQIEICETDDPTVFAQSIRELLSDQEKREKLARNALERVEEFYQQEKVLGDLLLSLNRDGFTSSEK